jgi:poly-beta-1,6-N-acetyl-D-glucosamine synthase
MNILVVIFYVVGVLVTFIAAFTLSYYPLALIAELRKRPNPVFIENPPWVSIVVPAYNEEMVVENCIVSILRSGYKHLELILVDDGSKDRTFEIMQKYKHHPRVKTIRQQNAGKAAALNRGLKASTGELIFFVDADSIFIRSTIPEMLKLFTSPKVGGVCGNDATVNLNKLQTRLQCLQTHVGTAFIRRALAEINCLPIISGNIGVFRRSALMDTVWPFGNVNHLVAVGPWPEELPGPFLEGFIGEDLELTWKIHKAGYQVNFAPHAMVLNEVPSTIKGLWKQRVRWARGFLQTVRIHKDMFMNLKLGPIGLYLPINYFNQVINPILQLILLILFGILLALGYQPIPLNFLNVLLWFGLGFALFATLFAVSLDRAWTDLKYLYVVPLWIPYSIMMDLVMVWAIIQELRGTTAQWNKLERTGVVSRKGA